MSNHADAARTADTQSDTDKCAQCGSARSSNRHAGYAAGHVFVEDATAESDAFEADLAEYEGRA